MRNGSLLGVGVVFLLIVFLYLFRLGTDGFHNRDEERFALAAQEMLGDGAWLTPTIRGNPLVTKPILFYWSVLIPSSLLGKVSEFSVKLPSVLAGLAGLLTIFLFGRELWSRRTGLLAALILATSYGYCWQARIAQVDMLLTLFIILALFCFYLGFKSEVKKRRYYLLGYASMALATLTKGPVGLLLPAAIILLFLILTKNLNRLKEIELIRGFFIYLLILTPWFVALSLDSKLGIIFLKRIFYQENLIRYQTLSKNVRPFYYYLFVLMGGLSLWGWMLPAGIRASFVKGAKEEREKSVFLGIWLVFILVFFSVAPFKRDNYLVPLYPAAALLIGRVWDLAISQDCRTGVLAWMRLGLGLIFFLVLLMAPVYAGYIVLRFPERMNAYFGLYLIFLVISAYAAFVLFARQKVSWSFALLFLQSYLFLLLLYSRSIPYPTREYPQPSKVLLQRLVSISQPRDEVISYQFWKPGLDFYLQRRVPQVRNLAYLNTQLAREDRIYCILKFKSYSAIKSLITPAHWLIGEGRYGHHRIVVISNKSRPILAPLKPIRN